MEAYKIKKETTVVIVDDHVSTPIASLPVKGGDIITIVGVDGMYCKGTTESGDRVYIAGWTQVNELKQ